MNLLIDLTQIPVQKTGAGVYALNLIKKIYERKDQINYYIVIQDDEDVFDYFNKKNFHLIRVKANFFRRFICRVPLEQLYLPYLAWKYKIDAVHSLHYSFPLFTTAKRIVNIYDLSFFKFPHCHTAIKRIYFRIFTRLASRFAHKLITISESSRNDFLQEFRIDPQRIAAIYLGCNHEADKRFDQTKITTTKQKFGITRDYILFIGTIEPRKNIKHLILAYDRLCKEHHHCQLVIAGKKGWGFHDTFKLIDSLPTKRDITFTGYITEKEKEILLSQAKIFVYPSLYEGFGIPVLESLAKGIPTITSNISSLPEIVEDAALLVNPNDVDELYLQMRKLLTENSLYSQLQKKSIVQAKKFSWDKMAAETIHIYNSLG